MKLVNTTNNPMGKSIGLHAAFRSGYRPFAGGR